MNVRNLLEQWTSSLRVYPSGEAPIKTDPRYRTFFSFDDIPQRIKRGLVKVYKKIFSDPPWKELDWTEEKILEKLKREMGILVVMLGDEEFPVAGFCWGTVVTVESLTERIKTAFKESVEIDTFVESLIKKGVKKILYLDEFAILPRFRGGIDPIRFLFRPALEMAWEEGVSCALFWSTPKSKIVPLGQMMGFTSTFSVEVEGKEITFLFNVDTEPVLKFAQSTATSVVKQFMEYISSKR